MFLRCQKAERNLRGKLRTSNLELQTKKTYFRFSYSIAKMTSTILNAYGLSAESKIEPLTSGLINRTWKVTDGENQLILQQINHQVFKKASRSRRQY